MGDTLIIKTESIFKSDRRTEALTPNVSDLCQRRIEFLPEKKPFMGFGNGGSDFRLETLNPSTSSDSRQPRSSPAQQPLGGKKLDGSEFLDYGLDLELSFGNTFRKIGAGLENLGNTCFLNSVLQCLTYTEPLVAYLQSDRHKNSCHIAGFCALCAIQKHVSRALQSTGSILVPKDLVSNLRCISRNFRNARQEDAHEYMVNLLESMHKCCLPSGVPSESPSAYEKSLVHKIFGGHLRSQVKCTQCSYCSDKFDPFLDLSLEIYKADSLHKALVTFTAAEMLDGGEKQYQCQRCKQKVRALKQLTVHRAPFVLTIHLKRFHSYDPGRKINKKVEFGCTLDLKPFVSGPYEGDLKYSLYGVLVHSGFSTHSGHYYCYVRTSNNVWYTLDDNRVHHVSEREVLNQQAYMLFYVRDRKNIQRKPVGAVLKENMKVNTNGTVAVSIFNQGLKGYGAGSPAAEAKRDSSNFSSSSLLLKDTSDQQTDKRVVAGSSASVPLRDTSEVDISCPSLSMPPSVLPPEKKFRGGESSAAETLTDQQTEKRSIGTGSSASITLRGTSKVDSSRPLLFTNASVPPIEKRCNGAGSSIAETLYVLQNNSISTVPEEASKPSQASLPKISVKGFNDLLKSSPSESDSIRFPNVKNIISPAKDNANCPRKNQICKSESNNLVSKAHVIADSKRSITQLVTGESTQKVEGVAVAIMREKACGDQPIVRDESVKVSTSSVITTVALDGEHDCKHFRKLKKKPLKYQVTGITFRSRLFFMSTLGPPKKKHRRGKRPTLDTKNLDRKQLSNGSIASDMGPSTSEKMGINMLESSQFQGTSKRGPKRGADEMASLDKNDNSVMEDNVSGYCSYRIDQSSAVLATSSQLMNQFEERQPGYQLETQKDTVEKGLENIVTQVAGWDGIQLPPSQCFESNADRIMKIGYVGDEWDEEYDQGKRKKVKGHKHYFAGPNPFQTIAAERRNFKDGKMCKRRWGNQPYRI